LIYHTSGLRDQWSLLGLAGWRYSLDLITDDDVLDLMSRQKELNFKPGDQHVYCNTGYTLLAQIVKRVSGQTFREFTTQRIFAPLDMPSTHFRDDHAEIVKHIAYGYIDGENGAGYRLSVTNFDTVGATSLLTTVEDLAHWDENFYHPRVGGATMVEQQLQRGKLNSGKELDYAFGLAHGKYRGLATVDHGGADAGYRADLLRFPEQHFSVACLCNKGEINPGELTRKVADVYLGKQFKDPPAHSEPPIQPVTVSEAKLTSKEHAQDGRGVTLAAQSLAEVPFCLAARSRALCAQYSGLYWKADDNRAVRVFSKDGKLFLAPSTDESLELTPLSESRFRLTVAPVTIVFEEASLRLQSDGAATADLFARVAEFKPRSDQLAAFAGDYRSAEIDPVYRITVENGGLVLKRLKSKPEKLEPTVQDHFMGLDGDIHFERDSAGQITGFVLDSGRIKNFHFQKATQL
jgi:hypothetical protein